MVHAVTLSPARLKLVRKRHLFAVLNRLVARTLWGVEWPRSDVMGHLRCIGLVDRASLNVFIQGDPVNRGGPCYPSLKIGD